MNQVFALILLLTADGDIVGHGGAAVESTEACHTKIAMVLQNIQIPEGAHAQPFCLNMKPLPTNDRSLQPQPPTSL